MISQINSIAFNGLDPVLVSVQVSIMNGNPGLVIVGLPDKAVSESKERIRVAINSIGLSMPAKRITVNLAPADILKEGSHFDLPITLGILAGMETILPSSIDRVIAMGEIFLNGKIGKVNGVLPAAIHANANDMILICPEENGREAALASQDLEIVAAGNLLSLINHLRGRQLLSRPETLQIKDKFSEKQHYCLSEVKGQEDAKRALKIVAAGGHNMLMKGHPGTGKSMLASALIGILPELDGAEMLDAAIIQSLSGTLGEGTLSNKRPYRAPHHSASMAAIVGGGRNAKPGEITLAHRGVLFFDEIAEFQRGVLDALRQPLETGIVTIARAEMHITYPAKFQFIAAMNPCKCGYAGDVGRQCNKVPHCVNDYNGKVSGPIMDRIDVIIDVENVNPMLFIEKNKKRETSSEVLKHIIATRQIQKDRYANLGFYLNSELNGSLVEEFCILKNDEMKKIMQDCIVKHRISMRGYTRILRLARTIADLEAFKDIEKQHLLEAISYRAGHTANTTF